MEETIGIQNKSGDKEYFTIIPNCVINGSSITEQALYLQIKRYAGETGFCFVSIRTLAKKLKVGKSKIIETVKELLKRGWIKKEKSHYTGGRPANCYSIVDVWQINIEKYKQNT